MRYIPRDYQIKGRDFLSSRSFAILGDAPGVGKTGQAIIAIPDEALRKPVLIVCPASVKLQWADALRDWRGLPSTIIRTSRDRVPPRGISILNYDLLFREPLATQLLTLRYGLIIFDEAHKLKSPTAKRTKFALGRKGLRPRAERIWCLTGTPVKNRPVDLFTLLKAGAPEVLKPYDTYLKYVYRFCGAYQGPFGLDVSGASHIEDLGQRLANVMLRREKRDVLTELPPRVVTTVEFECTPKVLEMIREEEERTLELAGEKDPALFTLGEQVRIRQALAKYKVPNAIKYIKDLLDVEDKIVVFYHHKEVLNELKGGTRTIGSVHIDGAVPADRRAGVVRTFNEDPDTRIFFGQLSACGEGIDGLQHICSTAVFVEPSWSHTDMEQGVGRLERSGQRRDVNIHILTIKDTIEADMMGSVAMKLRTDERLYSQQKKERPMKDQQKKLEQAKKELVKAFEGFLNTLIVLGAIELPPDTEVPEEAQNPPEEEVEEGEVVETEAPNDVDDKAVRAICNDICNKWPDGRGKKLCINAIQKVAGRGAKLADVNTPKKRVQLYEALDAVLNGGE